MACSAVRASAAQTKVTLKFVESLVKAQYPVYMADKEGKMPISYLLHQDVDDETLAKVFEWHVKSANFNVLKKPIQRYEIETELECFFFELIRSNRAKVKFLNMVKP